MAEPRTVRVMVSGVVQGVGFRAWTQRRANALGLSGWVRNCANGDVEAVISGDAVVVETMLAALKEGPRSSLVERVEVVGSAEPLAGAFTIAFDR